MTKWRAPLADVSIGPEEMTAVNDVLRSGWLLMGAVTEAFEAAFAAFIYMRACAMNSAMMSCKRSINDMY